MITIPNAIKILSHLMGDYQCVQGDFFEYFFPCILSPYFVDSLHSLLLLLLLSCYIKSDLLSSPTTAFGWGLKSFLNRRCVFWHIVD